MLLKTLSIEEIMNLKVADNFLHLLILNIFLRVFQRRRDVSYHDNSIQCYSVILKPGPAQQAVVMFPADVSLWRNSLPL